MMISRSTRNTLMALLAGAVGILMLSLPGIAAAKDRNHDRLPDRWEKRHGLSLNVNQAHRDQDKDGLVNRKEFLAGDDPLDPDSDGDGTQDGDENAGTIAPGFDGTTLTINLFNGGTVSGLVTADTEIQCDNGDDQGDEDGDNVGGGGDQGDDSQGDDDQGDDGSSCSTADLLAGAVVQEADLELVNGAATFTDIELSQ